MNIFLLILFFATNPLQNNIKGMEFSHDKGKGVATGPSSPYSPSHPTTPIDSTFPNMTFSLVEMSLFVRILLEIDEKKIKNNYENGLLEILRDYKTMVLEGLQSKSESKAKTQQELEQIVTKFNKIDESNLIENIFRKLEMVIEFYDNLLFEFQEKRTILMTEQPENLEDLKEFINNRFNSFRNTMNLDNFNEFLEKFGIILENDSEESEEEEEEEEKEENLLYRVSEAKIEILNLSDKNILSQIYDECIKITLVEQNIFILWHLFGFARNIIRSFVFFNNYYDELLNKFGEKISTLGYIKAYDIFEVKANYFIYILKQLNIYNVKDIIFEYKGQKFERKRMLMTLERAESNMSRTFGSGAESKEHIIYPATFSPIEGPKHIKFFLPLFYRHAKVSEENLQLSFDECVNIRKKLNLNPYTALPTSPFYLFYHKLDSQIKPKLEQFLINPYFIYLID
ncbi:hypothetical protein ACQ4LE_008184, partial [Meloidogyne hapla]